MGFKLAGKAPDAEHPFGHARYEYLAGLVVLSLIHIEMCIRDRNISYIG